MKKKLSIELDYDFLLFAISCHLKDYRVCWALNEVLDIALKKQDDLELYLEAEQRNYFSFYTFYDELRRLKYTVVANRGDKGFLLKEQGHMDYFLVIDGSHDFLDPNKVRVLVQSIRQVLTVVSLDPNILPSKQNLIFD